MAESMTSTDVPIQTKQILLVEDEVVFANAVKKHLQRKGYSVNLATDLDTACLLYTSPSPRD